MTGQAGRCNGITTSTKQRCQRGTFATAWRHQILSEDGFLPELPSASTHCRAHLPPVEKTRVRDAEAAREQAYERARQLPPACWSWPVPPEAVEKLRRYHDESSAADLVERVTLFFDALRLYDQGRCAICGRQGNEVEDHCHETGLVRGWLCRPCNTREGMNRGGSESTWAKYRQRNPYSVLGLREPYTGFGWKDGRPIGYEPGEWPPPPMTDEERWANNAMRNVGM